MPRVALWRGIMRCAWHNKRGIMSVAFWKAPGIMGLAAAPPRERTLHVLLTWRMAFFPHFAATQASSPRTCEQTSNRVASEAASAAARRTRTVCHWRDRLSVKIVETWEPRTVYNKPLKMKLANALARLTPACGPHHHAPLPARALARACPGVSVTGIFFSRKTISDA